jgi:glycosyltransferase involved in cell wall biosynthesis
MDRYTSKKKIQALSNNLEKKLVSVIIPAHNEEKNIGKCIKSFLNQSYQNIEVIVVDDGSTDNTYKIAKNYPIKLIRLEKNKGVSCARNIGLKNSRGEIVVFAEGDGNYSIKYIEIIIKPLNNKKIGGSIAGQRIALSEKDNIFVKYWNHRFEVHREVTAKGLRPVMGAWAFRKEIFDEVGTYDRTLSCGEDVDLVNRIKMAGYKVAAITHAEIDKEHILLETDSYILIAIPEKCYVYHKEPDTLIGLIKRTWWGSTKCKEFRHRWSLEPSGLKKILFVARNIAVLGLPLYFALSLFDSVLWIIPFIGILFAESVLPIIYIEEFKLTTKLALKNKQYKLALAMPFICWIEIRTRAFGNFYTMR